MSDHFSRAPCNAPPQLDDLLIGIEFPSPKRKRDFGEKPKIKWGQIWTIRWVGYSCNATSIQKILYNVSDMRTAHCYDVVIFS